MTAKRRLVLLVLAVVVVTGALVGIAYAQTRPRCTSHADAQHQGYASCGTDQLPR